MFFKLVSRNSKKNRKENGLFFASLLVSIVAFYIILSLSHQDVIRFLAEMESDAVDKLLRMIPLFYGVTLFILFFLIYFAGRFQLERRSHELGMYLMMGMGRFKLFLMLLFEDFRSSVISLVVGLPIAIFVSELVSLITARFVGLGIIGHHLSVSVSAIIWTIIGFLTIKFVSFIILSFKMAKKQIGDLLVPVPEASKKIKPDIIYICSFTLGVVFLVAAYAMAIKGISWTKIDYMGITLVMGVAGTILLFYGLRCIMGFMAGFAGKNKLLHTFTYRQLQENVIQRSTSLAISSLLILAGLCCFGSGVSIALYYGNSEQHVLDYTFRESNKETVDTVLKDNHLNDLFLDTFEMKVGYVYTEGDYDDVFNLENVMHEIEGHVQSDSRDTLLNNLEYATYPHIISLTDYNHLLKLSGEPLLQLGENEAAVYIDNEFITDEGRDIFNQVLETKPLADILGEGYKLTGDVQSVSLVTDRSITLSFALIIEDKDFLQLTNNIYDIYVNGVLDPSIIEDSGLMNAISETNDKLNATDLYYESYLQNMGRQLFYVVAASYITIYLAIIFLIIANTVIGVQFLTGQQKTSKRYRTLIRLGATYEILCESAKKQINWYFGIPIIVAVISSLFGIRALLTGLLAYSDRPDIITMMIISVAMILFLCVIEWIYIWAVKKSSNSNILKLIVPDREE